jgi:hypothetical protein
MFRRDRLAAIGGFPESLGPAADYAVYLELSRDGQVLFDARDAVRYRHHAGNMSRNRALMLRTTLDVLRRERPFVPATHLSALQAGDAAWRDFYGDHMMEELRASWRARRWGRRELTHAWTLLRHCRAVLAKHLVRKLSLIIAGTKAGAPTTPPDPDAPEPLGGAGDSRR